MVSYVVTGASRGLGLSFVQALHVRRPTTLFLIGAR